MIKFETELYEPIKSYFELKGYTVRGEVNNCDLTAVLGDELIIVEMKKSFNLKLLFQALDRQKLTSNVFVAIPRPNKHDAEFKQKINLLKRLELGLITVASDSPVKSVQVVLEAGGAKIKSHAKRQRLLNEIGGRSTDDNIGGSRRKKLVTAFRERSIHIACILEAGGELSPKQIRAFGASGDAGNILIQNHYGWFDRVRTGIYALSFEGVKALSDQQFSALTDYYRGLINENGGD